MGIFSLIKKSVQTLGKFTLNKLAKLGRASVFLTEAVSSCFSKPIYFKNLFKQMMYMGYYSLPVVGMTAIFTGAVLALQTFAGAERFNAESTVATVVVLSITRELGPVLAGLMVAGRVGGAIAAEIGTMKVTEQIDALKTLSTNPIKYLFVPRIWAGVIMLPVLVVITDIIGIMGGFLASVYSLGFSSGPYLRRTFEYLEFMDVTSGLIKSSVFGFIIAITGCYCGYHSKGGAEGVGKATTNSVVTTSILILLTNYLMTELFFV